MSRKSENAKNLVAQKKERIAELYVELSALEKQKKAYDSVVNNYGEMIKAFCATEEISQRDHLHDCIYSIAKENKHTYENINTNGYAFVQEYNGGIVIEFLGFEYTCYYHNKFDIDDDFRRNNAFNKERYDFIKRELEGRVAHLSEYEEEYNMFNPKYAFINNSYNKYRDIASIPYNTLYKAYEKDWEYATKVSFDIVMPKKGETYNREDVFGLIKTILATTECCARNGIPLNFHINDEYHIHVIDE